MLMAIIVERRGHLTARSALTRTKLSLYRDGPHIVDELLSNVQCLLELFKGGIAGRTTGIVRELE